MAKVRRDMHGGACRINSVSRRGQMVSDGILELDDIASSFGTKFNLNFLAP